MVVVNDIVTIKSSPATFNDDGTGVGISCTFTIPAGFTVSSAYWEIQGITSISSFGGANIDIYPQPSDVQHPFAGFSSFGAPLESYFDFASGEIATVSALTTGELADVAAAIGSNFAVTFKQTLSFGSASTAVQAFGLVLIGQWATKPQEQSVVDTFDIDTVGQIAPNWNNGSRPGTSYAYNFQVMTDGAISTHNAFGQVAPYGISQYSAVRSGRGVYGRQTIRHYQKAGPVTSNAPFPDTPQYNLLAGFSHDAFSQGYGCESELEPGNTALVKFYKYVPNAGTAIFGTPLAFPAYNTGDVYAEELQYQPDHGGVFKYRTWPVTDMNDLAGNRGAYQTLDTTDIDYPYGYPGIHSQFAPATVQQGTDNITVGAVIVDVTASATAIAVGGAITLTFTPTDAYEFSIYLRDGGAGGSFSPSQLDFTSATPQTATYTAPSTNGTVHLTPYFTNKVTADKLYTAVQVTGGSSGGLHVVSHPDFNVLFVESGEYLSGEVAPVKWVITRKDGANVDVPNAGVVEIRDDFGALVASLTPDVESAVPAPSQTVAALWHVPTVSGASYYTSEVTLEFASVDGQVRSNRTILTVT